MLQFPQEGLILLLKLQSTDNVDITNRPAWAKDGVMSAYVFEENGRKLVIGRGYQHASNQKVSRSVLFKATLKRYDQFKLDPTPFIKPHGREVEVSDPTVVRNPRWYSNQTVVLYSVGTPLGQNVTTDIFLSPLNKPSERSQLVDATKLRWFRRAIDKVKEPEVLGEHFFYEFGDGVNSRIAVATIRQDGSVSGHRLFLDIRAGSWDSDHVSTGPIIPLSKGTAEMVYNGMRGKVWAIGLLVFDTKTFKIISRSSKPLITPTDRRGPHNQRISFSSSAILEKNRVLLYYHEADQSIKVATLAKYQS
jgi:predicted GH43/DUF377 family glycosyl hydrolase